jgi:hypothetical protein
MCADSPLPRPPTGRPRGAKPGEITCEFQATVGADYDFSKNERHE